MSNPSTPPPGQRDQHIAAISHVQPQKLREANAALKKELETKAEVRQRTQLQDLVTNAPRDNVLEGTKIGYVNQALRANSNRQVKQGSALSQLTSLDEQ